MSNQVRVKQKKKILIDESRKINPFTEHQKIPKSNLTIYEQVDLFKAL